MAHKTLLSHLLSTRRGTLIFSILMTGLAFESTRFTRKLIPHAGPNAINIVSEYLTGLFFSGNHMAAIETRVGVLQVATDVARFLGGSGGSCWVYCFTVLESALAKNFFLYFVMGVALIWIRRGLPDFVKRLAYRFDLVEA